MANKIRLDKLSNDQLLQLRADIEVEIEHRVQKLQTKSALTQKVE